MHFIEEAVTREPSYPFTPIPPECVLVDKLFINPQIAEGNRAMREYADPDFLLNNCLWMSVPGATDLPVGHANSQAKRERILEQGRFVSTDGHYYGFAISVGTGGTPIDRWESLQTEYLGNNEPYGLVGFESRKKDYELTSAWEGVGVLTSKTAALIPFDPDKLVDWYTATFPSSRYKLARAVSIVSRNGDIPAQQIRFVRALRISDIMGFKVDANGKNHKLRQGLVGLSHEFAGGRLDDPKANHLLHVARRMVGKHSLSWTDLEQHHALRVLTYFIGRNFGLLLNNQHLPIPDAELHNIDLSASFIDGEIDDVFELLVKNGQDFHTEFPVNIARWLESLSPHTGRDNDFLELMWQGIRSVTPLADINKDLFMKPYLPPGY